MADTAHLKNIRDICNNQEFDLNTTIEDELIAQIDDEMTFIKSTRTTKNSLPVFSVDDDSSSAVKRSRRREGEDKHKRGSNDGMFDSGTFIHDDDASSTSSDSSAASYDSNIYGDPLSSFKIDPAMAKSNKLAQKIYKGTGGSGRYEAADTLYEYDEDRAEHIENINRMRASLISSNVNVDDIPIVDEKSSMSDVRATLKRITKRYDSVLYSDTGSDIIIGICQCLEGIFNGKRVLFGVRPDLTGWTDQYVRPHMTHFRHETSRMVAEYVESLGVGRLAKMLFLLVPGALVFMATSRNSSGVKNDEYGKAMNNLGSMKK